MQNQNESTVTAYDIVYAPYTNAKQTNRELAMVRKFCPRGRILDLGCGTGRHLIPLIENGYEMIGMDSSEAMLSILKKKLQKKHLRAKLVNADITKTPHLNQKFDGIICFFNALTEMAKSKSTVKKVMRTLNQLLKKNGVLIIEQTFPVTRDFEKYVYRYKTKKGKKTYEVLYQVLSYDKKTHTTTSLERITIATGKQQKVLEATIIQHWLEKAFLDKVAQEAGFSTQFLGGDFKAFKPQSDKFFLVARK